MEVGTVVIDPFDISQLNTSSYDVRIGKYYFRKNPRAFVHKMYSPYSASDISEMWGDPIEAKPAINAFSELGQKVPDGVLDEDLVIILGPGEHILCHTIEFIGGRDVVTTHMQARSSVGRQDIVVCRDAGWGDVGYFNRWTMEVGNDNLYQPTFLIIGTRVAQIVFSYTGGILDSDYSVTGNYQNTDKLEELKANWNPTLMLPKPLSVE